MTEELRDSDLRRDAIKILYKYGVNDDGSLGSAYDELITLITKEKSGEIFDRCIEAVRSLLGNEPDSIYESCLNEAIKAIDNLRGSDEEDT